MSKLVKRILVAAALIVVVGLLLYVNGWALAAGFVILAVMAEYEMAKAVSAKGDAVCKPILLAFTVLLPVGYFFFSFEGAFIVFALCLTALFICSILSNRYTIESASKGMFAFIYPQLLFLFFYAVIFKADGASFIDYNTSRFVIIATAAISVMTDTMAYFIGSAFGKHKLCPQISPKKSVEGAFGGLFGGALGAVIVMLIFNHTGVSLWGYLVFSVIASALSQFGDLTASLVKRKFEIKDYSRVLGEHGGIMDRLDSILFIMPYSYIFFFMISNL